MVGSRDSAARALVLADIDELVESRRALDGGLVHLLVHVNVVHRSVRSDGAFMGGSSAGAVTGVAFRDVVFDKGTCGPSVHGEIANSGGIGLPGSAEVDRSGGRRKQCFSQNSLVLSNI